MLIRYLIVMDDVTCVKSVKIVPNPKKYGQLFSMYVKRLCSSQLILHHLYSNEYNEYNKHKCTLHTIVSTTELNGNKFTNILWIKNNVCTNNENNVSAMITLKLNSNCGWPLRNLYAESAISWSNMKLKIVKSFMKIISMKLSAVNKLISNSLETTNYWQFYLKWTMVTPISCQIQWTKM